MMTRDVFIWLSLAALFAAYSFAFESSRRRTDLLLLPSLQSEAHGPGEDTAA